MHISRNTFQWLLPDTAYAIWKTILRNLNYFQCLNIALSKRHSLWPQLNKASMEKALWLQWNIPSWFIALMEKAWFSERFFFEVVIVMVNVKQKKYSIRGKMSIKISFMHYIKCTRVNVTSTFWGSWNGYIFLLLFSIYYHCQLVKGQP